MYYTIGIHPLCDCDLKSLEDEYYYGSLHCASDKSSYDDLRLEAILIEIKKRKQENG